MIHYLGLGDLSSQYAIIGYASFAKLGSVVGCIIIWNSRGDYI